MPDEINLESILKVERDKRKKLVPLEDDFYDRVAEQIYRLENEKRRINDPYSTKYAMLEDELKTMRKAIEGIIYNRTTKIINEARHDAEIALLHGDTQKEKPEMTEEERNFYNKLFELMIEFRGTLLDKIFRNVQTQPPSKTQEKKSKGKKDISKEYMLVRLLRDIPTFVGADGRNHTLAREDVAVLSAMNAKALINRNVAKEIMVKR